tara:strand:- start:1014 stop:1961 length:948 start_codon:yes stop_codon:yes gene_type:complete
MIKKNFPIKKPYFYDTKEGIDYFTKLSIEENPKKLTPKELADIHKLNKDMKRSALEDHSKKLKKFDNLDPTTYPSDPVQRGTLLEIGKLEKDLEVPPGQRKPRRNIWDEYVKTGQLPELTAEERIRAKGPSDWDVVYGSMSPMEKGQWNAEQRRKKIQRQKEDEEERRQKRIANHTKQQWGIPEKKLTDLPIIKSNINYQKIPNQDLKSKMRGWINEADNEKKQNEKKQEVITKKSLPGVQSILAIDTPEETTVTREETPSLNQRLRNSKVAVGLSPELLGLQKQINRNIDYVLGTDQKERLERRELTPTKKEEN